MKHLPIVILISLTSCQLYGQSIVTTSESKSGILGANGSNDFVGIGYESSTNAFEFNYKWVTQDNSVGINGFPNYSGVNAKLGIGVEKGVASLVKDDKWQGGFDMEVTGFRMWELKDQAKLSHYLHSYISVTDGFERIKLMSRDSINPDTTFVTLSNPLKNTFVVKPGVYWVGRWAGKDHLSVALSTSFSFIYNSTRHLDETNLTTLNAMVYNSSDSTKHQVLGDTKKYFDGEPKAELFTVPRLDLFYRHSFESKLPALGLLFAYSPMISSLEDVSVRHAVALGPTIGLAKFPDQVIFALMNEWVQNNEGVFKYRLTFQATFPINFK